MDLLSAVLAAGPIGLSVLFLLLGFSVLSWAVILFKFVELRKARVASQEFADLFWKLKRFDELFELSERYPNSPLAHVFRQGYKELSVWNKEASKPFEKDQAFHGMESIEHALRKASMVQMASLERMIPFLATVGSTSPFIGLFGTVVGIIRSFQMIGLKGSANLATVAPGIAEALVATAAGLVVAIPAVMAYNYFSTHLRALSNEMSGFSNDFVSIVRQAWKK